MDSDAVNRAGAHPATNGSNAGHRGALPAGTRLSEFELERVLGEGGFSLVYLAFDHTLERHVAIKEYLPGEFVSRCDDGAIAPPRSGERRDAFEAGLRSFIDEARLLARFEHPALVKVLRFWEANGTAYMAMPHYAGGTLREILKADPGFATEARLKALISPLLDAVALLHAEGCFHRDIAPDNIIVQPNGAPVLLDFGAARRIIGDMTHALTVVLKPGYAPIEQYAEEGGPAQGPWTDVYALAAVLYAAIKGKPPLAAVARAYDDALVPLQLDPPPGYSMKFLCGIDAALAVRPEARPQSITAFRVCLGLDTSDDSDRTILVPRTLSRPAASPPAALGEQPTHQAPSPAAPPQPFRYRPRVLVAGVAVGVASLGLALYFTTFSDRSGNETAPIVAATSPPPVPAAPLLRDPRDEVRTALLALECAHASFDLSDTGLLTVDGHVQDSAQRTELEQRLRNIAGVKDVRSNLALVPRPFCEITTFVEGLRTVEGRALEVRVVQPKPPLRVGQQPVFVDVVAPDFAASIAVDVWSLAEKEPNRLEVAHLLPHAGYSLSDQFKANERKTIDRIADGKIPQVIRVYPPAGRLLFTAIASDQPLVQRDRELSGDPSKYVATLRATAGASGTNPRIATWYGFVEVLPRLQ